MYELEMTLSFVRDIKPINHKAYSRDVNVLKKSIQPMIREIIDSNDIERPVDVYVDEMITLNGEFFDHDEYVVELPELKEYEIVVTTHTTVYVEAESEDEAKEKAKEKSWHYEPDRIEMEIVANDDE